MLSSTLRRLVTPTRTVAHVSQIEPEWLRERGITGVVCDLDNTLVVHNRQDVADDVAAWLQILRAGGVGVCLLSNTRRLWRLADVGAAHDLLHVPTTAGKPGTAGLARALEMLQIGPTNAAMVGDQLFTDIVCGNRAGVAATILVTPLSATDFIGTRLISRPLEHFVKRRL